MPQNTASTEGVKTIVARSRSLHPVGRRRSGLAAMQTRPLLAGATPMHAQGRPPIVIGWLSGQQLSFMLDGFIDGMAAQGWKLGTHSVLKSAMQRAMSTACRHWLRKGPPDSRRLSR